MAAGAVTEAVADVAEQVATEALEVADTVRVFDGRAFGLGIVAGALIAGGTTYLIVERRLRTKYEQIAEEEISQMREHFQAKVIAMEDKPALDGLVKDLGYVPAAEKPDADPGTPQTAITAEERNVFETQRDEVVVQVDANEGWDYDTERSKRTAGKPYVIHRDEQEEMPGLSQSTFTYYEGDDVLCDERDRVVDARDEILGDFVEKFGHGSGDPNVVYVRNEELGVEIEVCRSPNSYAEEVHGFKHSDETSMRTTRRVSFDDV